MAQEFDLYAQHIDEKDSCLGYSNLGQGSSARNFAGTFYSKSTQRHWILDDNINGFVRLNKGLRGRGTSVLFNAIEDFVDRYENIKMAGMNYRFFAGSWIKRHIF